jgi:hypothetical protein
MNNEIHNNAVPFPPFIFLSLFIPLYPLYPLYPFSPFGQPLQAIYLEK